MIDTAATRAAALTAADAAYAATAAAATADAYAVAVAAYAAYVAALAAAAGDAGVTVYQIQNTTYGTDLGAYAGEDGAAAIRAMLDDAGVPSDEPADPALTARVLS